MNFADRQARDTHGLDKLQVDGAVGVDARDGGKVLLLEDRDPEFVGVGDAIGPVFFDGVVRRACSVGAKQGSQPASGQKESAQPSGEGGESHGWNLEA